MTLIESNNWVFLSLLSAFTLATSDAMTKKVLSKGNEYLTAWFRLLFSLPLLIILLMFIPIPKTDGIFFRAFAIALPLEIIAIIFYTKALHLSPLSLTLPFLSLTPVFLILISLFILGERVSLMGGAGILLIAAGGYLLNLHNMKKGFFEPLKNIRQEKGSLCMIIVALIYAFTSSFGKLAIEHSSPLYFGILYYLALSIAFIPIALWRQKGMLRRFIAEGSMKKMIFPGICYSIMVIAHMTAISMTKVAYMISLKRTSLLIGVLYGYFMFGELNIRERFAGASLMFAGFVLIVTAS